MKKLLTFPLVYFFFMSSLALATDLPPLHLPDDEGAHHYTIEWWYYTGHLESLGPGPHRKFAFEMTVFKGELFHPVGAYVAHFAFIDLDKKTHHPFERINPFASLRPPAPTQEGFKFFFDGGKWIVEGKDGHDRLRAKTSEYSMDLKLNALKAASLFGDQGIVDYGAAGKMAYYSRTRMATFGTVTIPDEKGRPRTYGVSGTTWMDHQWGDSGNPTQMGWDWFSIQLKNEIDLMVFRVRNRATQEILKTSGFIVSETGEVSSIPEELIEIEALDSVGNIRYPSEWKIKVPAPFDIDLITKARFLEQRFKVPAQVTPIYWEGSCTTEGIFGGIPVTGEGFTEMAGYE
jgi:predicted secreted hydrolase